MSHATDPNKPAAQGAVWRPDAGHGADAQVAALGFVPKSTSGGLAAPVRNRSRWRALALCEVANFAPLRRALGQDRANALILNLIEMLRAENPDVHFAALGRTQIELTFEAESAESAAATIFALRKAIAAPIEIDGETHFIHAVFGLASIPGCDHDGVHLAEAAESALAQARAQGRTVTLDLSHANHSFDRLGLMRELPGAIARGEMFLQYQPKLHVRRQCVASAEALIRWQHPTRGLILPGDFVPLAEETGEITSLTLWTLDRVIADQRALVARGRDFPLFVNISGVLLSDASFVEKACRLIRDSGANIGFEITETSVIRDPDSAIRHLNALVDIGVKLAIDDYGAGLSSLAYLKQLPAAELKIDKMFVTQLTSSNRDPLIVRSTIDLAHAMEMEVTAEGVETPSALALLSVMGCDMVQGYLISRPLGLDAFQRYLAEDGHLSARETPATFMRSESFWKRA